MTAGIRPLVLRRDENAGQLIVEWSDGVTHYLAYRNIRLHCPCAGCLGHSPRSPDKPGVDEEVASGIAPDVRIERMEPVGNYAYHIRFSDGHSSGIFTLELLRELGGGRQP